MSRRGGPTVGIDIGTTSVKAVAVDADGQVLARARIRHPLLADSADQMRHDPSKAWRRGPVRALKALGDVRPVAISVCGMVPSLAAVGPQGKPLSEGLLYGDAAGRAVEASEAARALVSEAPQFLCTLAGDHPDAVGFWPAQTTALVALGGPPVISTVTSMGLEPLAVGGGWNDEVLRACRVTPERLPQIVPDGVAVGERDGVLLDPGGIDVMCEQIVSGATHPDDVLVLCGSTLIVFAHVPPEAMAVASATPIQIFPDGRGGGLATTASNAGGIFLDWVDRVVVRSGGTVRADDVPVWSPYIRGERTPWQNPLRRGHLADLHIGHGGAAVRRAAFEASGFVVRHHLDLLGVEGRRIVAVGGGTRSSGWMQALADATGLPVDVRAVPDGAAIGAAFAARQAAGLEPDLSGAGRWAKEGHRVQPDPAWQAAVGRRYRRFRQLADESPGEST